MGLRLFLMSLVVVIVAGAGCKTGASGESAESGESTNHESETEDQQGASDEPDKSEPVEISGIRIQAVDGATTIHVKAAGPIDVGAVRREEGEYRLELGNVAGSGKWVDRIVAQGGTGVVAYAKLESRRKGAAELRAVTRREAAANSVKSHEDGSFTWKLRTKEETQGKPAREPPPPHAVADPLKRPPDFDRSQKMTMEVTDAKRGNVFKLIAKQGGRWLGAVGESTHKETISLRTDSVPVDAFAAIVFDDAGLGYRQTHSGVMAMEPERATRIAEAEVQWPLLEAVFRAPGHPSVAKVVDGDPAKQWDESWNSVKVWVEDLEENEDGMHLSGKTAGMKAMPEFMRRVKSLKAIDGIKLKRVVADGPGELKSFEVVVTESE